MDTEVAKYIASSLAIIAMLATAPAEAYLAAKAFEAIGRNPKLESSLFGKVIVSIALVESTAIYALIAFFTIINS
ncbi:F0F1 ATP synthase subunit C [Candidatus Dojkabacteria bacterium]|uniref:ATP synthase F(0) sector subunit c n=1 Tax=Candidatus Dojkabacteria bacterium TaxID=2099670 RepID=A0A3M0Z118_9BACT|nr:MAG: F0F1 ATP synthase subunit C [Candidatus Dojkabacteria bacterium]